MEPVDVELEIPSIKRYKIWNAKKEKPRRSAKETAKTLVRGLPTAGIFFLFSLAQCFSVPSPFTISAVTAMLCEGVHTTGAFAGLAAGLLFRVLWRLPLDIGQFGACLCCFPLIRAIQKTEGQVYLLLTALLIGRAFPGILESLDGQSVILYASGTALGLASFPALRRCAQMLRDKPAKISRDDLLCLFLPLYAVYWNYASAQRTDRLAKQNGVESKLDVLCLVLGLVIGFLPSILMQEKFNRIELVQKGVFVPDFAADDKAAPAQASQATPVYDEALPEL